MKLILSLLLAAAFVAVLEQPADAQFLFPRLREARANAQSRALIAVNNQRALQANLRANVFLAPQKVVVASPFVHGSVRSNVLFFKQPSYTAAFVSPSYSAAFVAPRYYAAPVVQPYFQPLQALAIPQYQSYQSFAVSSGGYCGF